MEATETDIVVIGGGPGGYTAAFYAAAKGQRVVLVEKARRLGGVCLNSGCIPSKALLHVAKVVHEAKCVESCGIEFPKPAIHLSKLRNWKDAILIKLTHGLMSLAGRRNVTVIFGEARFHSSKVLEVDGQRISFDHAIIATGSAPAVPKIFNINDKRVMTSTEALEIDDIPSDLLVVGGGYIGMELGTVYAALGSQVVVAEALGGILLGADPDLARIVQDRAMKIFSQIRLNAKVTGLKAEGSGIRVAMEFEGIRKEERYDRVLVAVGRVPISGNLGLEKLKIAVDEKGFIRVDKKHRTTVSHIYAVGDVAGGMLLAHKASRDAKAAVDHILREDPPEGRDVMPAVVFTDPEVAWCGVTEEESRSNHIPAQIVKFPWGASGRAASMDRTDGMTKLLIDPKTEEILGVGICGVGAGELIGEASLAIQMGAKAADLARGIRPHPTLSETLTECAEMFYGHSTNVFSRKRG